ncbi:aspartate--tRNA ligase [Candidatus Woesearchaeota archaeon]|nr:aspartate--tRNA ligase [Candidatus Woesearchaeota archaeon]
MKRTHTCNDLRVGDIDSEVCLNGWVQNRRDHGGIIFIDLRDRFGLTQIVFDPKTDSNAHGLAESLRREDVLEIRGKVRHRGEGLENPKLDTGKIEIITSELNILNKAETPPLEIEDRVEAGEEMRLRYRYLDLRRPVMQKNLLLRHNVMQAARKHFNSNGFIEIQTPMLVKSTPEGARDYVVPSRVNPGDFYALPQSPQLYKQILMISGVDRYYQFPICLRDEDLRQDRQPEHTQMDFEMSFVESDDIRNFVEGLYKSIFKDVLDVDVSDFPIFDYKDAMDKYGTDKPDIRYELFLSDVTDIVVDSDFGVFKSVAENGGIIKCINPKKNFGRKEIDAYIEFCQRVGAKGMAWMRVTDNGLESNIAKYFKEDIQKRILERTGAKPGSILMFIADKPKNTNAVLSRLRQKLADDMGMIDNNVFRFCWVKDFPLFAWNEEENRWEPEHHMFSNPKPEFIDDFEKRPGEVIGDLWDLVLNGTELGSGSIRVNVPSVQERIMNLIGINKEDADMKFGFLLEAYKYGGPPHGGMGLGLDRTVALMAGTSDIREVIAFPKNKSAQCPMDSCPSRVDDNQLKELNIKLNVVRAKKSVFDQIKQLLDKAEAKYDVVEHKAVFTSRDAAKVRGTELKQGCKALICHTDKGFVQAVVPGDSEIDLNAFKKAAGFSSVELADAKNVKRITDCNIGSVPPFANLFDLPVFIDKAVTENEIVAFNAGSHTKSIKMKSEDLIKATNARIFEFSVKSDKDN